jgi:ATP-dependent DNA helicase RecQ
MDLPDVDIIVQWRATCDLCTLWQRFGRAARGAGREAKAILFVEKKDTNEERALKAKRAAQRLAKKKEGAAAVTGQKRKAETQLTSPASKRSALGDSTNHKDQTIVRELRHAHYKKRPATQTEKDGKKANLEVGSPMDDFINAAGDLDCRRIVSALFFDNDRRREFYLRSAATITPDSRLHVF